MKAVVLEDTNYSAALSVVRTLGGLGRHAVVTAPFQTPAMCSRWYREGITSPPLADATADAWFLLSLVRTRDFDVGFIFDDSVIKVVSRIRAELPSRPKSLLPPAPAVEIARAKVATARFAASLGIPALRTAAPGTADELNAAARDMKVRPR